MNSKKLWHSFALLTIYLLSVAAFSYLLASLFQVLRAPWLFPFILGVCIWVFALICLILREKINALFNICLPSTALACAFLIAAFIVGKEITLSFGAIFFFALFVSACYLVYMLFFTVPKLSEYLWYQIVVFVVWLTASILFLAFFSKNFLALCGETLPYQGYFVAFFSILLGFLAFGAALDAENFTELWQYSSIPMLVATGILAILILLVLSEGDGCDCDCNDCSDCGDCRRKKSTKRYSNASPYSYDSLSKGL